jgi:4-hydroxybenzoyl-CoA thioesterase
MAIVFNKAMLARWQDCDPAGIIYYPKYFEMMSALLEDWFEEALGLAYTDLHGARRLGLPTVRISCDFVKPCRLGDTIALSLCVTHLGRSSMSLAFRGNVKGAECLRCEQTLVMISKETFRAADIPDDLRALIEPYLASDLPRKEAS